jgi:hypothetical protein
VVAVDGLRADALGCYGATDAATPNFDALAAESVRFEWAFAQAADPAVSMAGLLSGLYPTTSGVRDAGDILPDEAETLAESLTLSALATYAAFEGVPGGNTFGLGQGFLDFYMGPNAGTEAAEWIGRRVNDDFLMVFRGWSAGWEFGRDVTVDGISPPDGFFERLQEVLASDVTERPISMEPEDVEYARGLYATRIRAIDQSLGEFMADLRASPRTSSTRAGCTPPGSGPSIRVWASSWPTCGPRGWSTGQRS